MEDPLTKYCRTAIASFASWTMRHSLWIVGLAIAASLFSTFYAVTTLRLNTDMSQMLSASLPYRQAQDLFQKTFPQFSNLVLLVVEANTPEMAHSAVSTIEERLIAKKHLIESIYVPDGDPYWKTHALLYLSEAELEEVATALARSEPFIDELSKDLSFSGLVTILSHRLNGRSLDQDLLLGPLFVRISQAIRTTMAGLTYSVSWPHVLLNHNSSNNQTTRFLVIQPKLDYLRLFPAGVALDAIHQVIDDIQIEATPDLRIRVTGEVALAHDELQSVSRGAGVAAIVALIMVSTVLLIGLRSVRLLVATLLTLGMGLALTAGYAAFAIGHLNMISVAFAVLFVGLGVDYVIHLCLRYRERLAVSPSIPHALYRSLLDVGPSIVLCAVTTAIGFYSFLPTQYDGMAELGLISGTSMFIGMLCSLIVLPALLHLMPLPSIIYRPPGMLTRLLRPFNDFAVVQGRPFRWGAGVVVLITVTLLPYATFDRNPHNLRNPDSESVTTFNDLLHSESASPWTLSVLAPNEAMAQDYASRLNRLNSVKKVLTIHSFVPNQEFGKFGYIKEIVSHFSQNHQYADQVPRSKPIQVDKLDAFLETLNHHLAEEAIPYVQDSALSLRAQLKDFLSHLAKLKEDSRIQVLNELEQRFFDNFFSPLHAPQDTNSFGPVTLDRLPQDLQDRWVSKGGIYRVQVFPENDLSNNVNLQSFVNDVRSVVPEVTDLPVTYTDGGDEVIWAFQQAFLIAVTAIFALLLIVFRSLKDALMVMLPLVIAGMLTAATSVVLDMPFNFANVIALPLLFGLGADNGIHIVHRVRRCLNSGEELLHTSTIRGVILSSFTTIMSFSGLAFSSHLGMASMGQFLAIGVFFTLICSVIILPAFLGSQQPTPFTTPSNAIGINT